MVLHGAWPRLSPWRRRPCRAGRHARNLPDHRWRGDRMMNRRSLLTAALALGAATSMPVAAFAQDYPARPIRVLVPYAAGGIADLVARILGDKLTGYWGQQVVIENKPG